MTTRRKYEETHPWITFRLDLNQAHPNLWTLLGQAVTFCRQVSQAALPPDIAKTFKTLYLSKGVRATTAIEGNTLTEEQVQAQIEGKLDLPPSQEYLQQEVANILRACGIIESAMDADNPPRLSVDLIREYNGWVLEGLGKHLAEGVVPGKIRTHSVGVGSYRAAPPEDCDYLLERLCEWLEEKTEIPFFADDDDRSVAAGILHAVLVHLYIAWIHPFGDGNGRTARLLEFMVQARAGVPFPSAHLLSDHYNMTRTQYYRELDRSSQIHDGKGDAFGFLQYALQGFVDGLQEQCEKIQGHQLAIVWEHFIYGVFAKQKRSSAMQRRRELVLELGRKKEFISKAELTDLSPSIARYYADKTDKTLTRDLNWLAQEGLIVRKGRQYLANMTPMWTFVLHLRVDRFASLLFSAHSSRGENE
ncbi:MAG: Fic family protein [Bacteroidetes bacterium SB0662_bin_6]|nr:Fic family protein [Bacteroidetes bacterium SB0668_bin_1]MYE05308.1 Fic family protein [Bacteroidetes bacterium SB0662_bin_6]